MPGPEPQIQAKPEQDTTSSGSETELTLVASTQTPFRNFQDPRTRPLQPSDILRLQQTIGNRAVMRLLDKQKAFSRRAEKSPQRQAVGQAAEVTVQRVPAEIDPTTIAAYRQFSDDTNINPVFKLEF